MPDEALAAINLRNASSVDIETNHPKSAFHGRHGQRNTDVAKTDDADAGRHVFEGSQQIQRIRIERADFYKVHSTPPFSDASAIRTKAPQRPVYALIISNTTTGHHAH